MLQCLNSGLPIKVISDDKICPDSDTFRGSSRAMRRKQYERLQSKMREAWSRKTPRISSASGFVKIELLDLIKVAKPICESDVIFETPI